MVEIQYKLRESDLIAFSEFQVKADSPLQKQMKRHANTIPGILCACALFYFFYYEDVFTAGYIGGVGVVWGLLAPLYFRKDFRRKVRRQFSEEQLDDILGQYKLRVELKALVEISPQGENRILWKDILRLELTKKYGFIYLDADEAMIIPLDTISHGKIIEFADLVNERIEDWI